LTKKAIIELEWFETKKQAKKWLRDFKENIQRTYTGMSMTGCGINNYNPPFFCLGEAT